ncbi:Gfo/Idh/MocA family protein [Reichenbachiella ulvae]|uniref:Gfo/Idh/MocA family oxidoreductase n=1 Tax=Reichenbachiella ulvae TaxID=2980104 RepID=A0ABT3CYX7_9BACT|nr:Gfo/Idh/MocA family oxidoreductase [Reichenbachiella ulvae]MCV9388771.1 Gfo/Idh/MocA family oxidoreductase [Reichenbachiella ulvae]
MKHQKIRWGILGPGAIAQQFAHDFQFVTKGELVAVASRSKERGEAFAKEYGIPKVYNSYEALYADPEVDAIYVATPHNFHLEQSSAALKAGKAVLCEKPITINPAELEELLVVAKDTNQYLMEGMWTYFLPAIQKAQQWVDEGRIGTVHHIISDFGYPVPFDANGRMFNPDLAGGALLDMGIYTLAMNWLFLKKDPDQFHVRMSPAQTGVDEEVTMHFEYADCSSVLTTSFRCKLPNYTHIIGEKGYISIPDFWRAKECSLYEVEERVDHFVDDRGGFGFNFETEQVCEDLLAGRKESAIMPHYYSRKLQEWMAMVAKKF